MAAGPCVGVVADAGAFGNPVLWPVDRARGRPPFPAKQRLESISGRQRAAETAPLTTAYQTVRVGLALVGTVGGPMHPEFVIADGKGWLRIEKRRRFVVASEGRGTVCAPGPSRRALQCRLPHRPRCPSDGRVAPQLEASHIARPTRARTRGGHAG